jgi:predicted DNA-binding transcriptional regulator YafY
MLAIVIDTSTRLLRLLTVLQARRFWAGADLAERLEVTSRTLRRDIERLRSLGYVIEATSGPGGGYQLGKGSQLPPLMLDDDEAVAVTVALRSAADGFAGLEETALGVLTKLDQLLPARLRQRVGALQAMTVSVGGGGAPAVDPERLTTIAAACRDRERIELTYRGRGAETSGAEGDRYGGPPKKASTRQVEPLRLAHTGSRRWYLLAWDLGREDWRTFRVDRIERIEALGVRFAQREPPGDVASYVADSISHAPYRHRAVVKLQGSVSALAERVPPWCGVLEPLDGESCLLRTGAESVEGLVCQLILAGVDFELVEPRSLRPKIRRIVERLERAVG